MCLDAEAEMGADTPGVEKTVYAYMVNAMQRTSKLLDDQPSNESLDQIDQVNDRRDVIAGEILDHISNSPLFAAQLSTKLNISNLLLYEFSLTRFCS